MNKDQIQKEALDKILPCRLAGVNISMGVGKTLLGLKHMSKNYHPGVRFLVAGPKKPILQSWKDEIEKYELEYLLDHIDFTTYLSLEKYNPVHYDVVYLDECHSLKYHHGHWLDQVIKNGGKILGLTGTYPVHKSSEKGEMCMKYCPLVYEYKVDDAVGDKILNDYKIYIHSLTLNTSNTYPVTDKEGNLKWMSSERRAYDYWSNRLDGSRSPKETQMLRIMRMKALQDFPSKLEYVKNLLTKRKYKTIVFANTQAQADMLCEHSFHSNNPRSEENLALFKDGTIEVLSAVEQLSEGVSIPNLRSGIIMHAYSNNRKASQKMGRMLRLNPKETAAIHILCYVDTVDKDWVLNAISHLDQSKVVWL
jgi:superfamily II DNA or RNA helicase